MSNLNNGWLRLQAEAALWMFLLTEFFRVLQVLLLLNRAPRSICKMLGMPCHLITMFTVSLCPNLLTIPASTFYGWLTNEPYTFSFSLLTITTITIVLSSYQVSSRILSTGYTLCLLSLVCNDPMALVLLLPKSSTWRQWSLERPNVSPLSRSRSHS